jgi:arsenite/tail-anchored protein-transporting ATPase
MATSSHAAPGAPNPAESVLGLTAAPLQANARPVAADSSFSQPLQLFTGKGGVGKSSVVAALALEASRRGQSPLIVELGHRASMHGVFGVEGIGYEPREIAAGVWAMNIEFEAALIDYLVEHVKVRALSRAIAENRTLRGFFDAAPSVPEIVTLNRLRQLLEEKSGASPRWRPILVDLDATGHALMLLELPSVLDGLIASGPLRRLLRSVSALMADGERTRLHVVTLPGELPAQETIELYQKLARRKTPLGALIVNQVPAPPFGPDALSVLDRLEGCGKAAGSSSVLDDVRLARRAIARHALACEQLDKLARALPLPIVELPQLRGGQLEIAELALLGQVLGKAAYAGAGSEP